jgi:hypothetical protein
LKTIIALIILSLSAISAQAGLRELTTQRTERPDAIGNVISPNDETLIARGWRYEPEVPPIAEGYTRLSIRLAEGDGRTGAWVVADRLTTEIEAEKAAAEAQAETERQAAKSDALKGAENAYLTICQQLTGKRNKLGFAELEAIITGLMATDPNTAVALTLRLLTVDAAGKREGGNKWWDDISWHQEVVP